MTLFVMVCPVKIYCDTDTLFSNIKRHEHQAKEQVELNALKKLFAFHKAGRVVLLCSLGNLRELERTGDTTQRQRLRADYENLPGLPNDERFYGTESLTTDPYGGSICNPLVSDVQDEAMLLELKNRQIEDGDAKLITQAVCNHCDIFMTRDEGSIIKPHRAWLERRFPTLRVCLPSEALLEVQGRLGLTP